MLVVVFRRSSIITDDRRNDSRARRTKMKEARDSGRKSPKIQRKRERERKIQSGARGVSIKLHISIQQ